MPVVTLKAGSQKVTRKVARKYVKRRYKRKAKPKSYRQIASKMKITKCHQLSGLGALMPFGNSASGVTTNSHWWFTPLCNLQRFYPVAGGNVGQSYMDDLVHRESSRIYHKNSTIQLDIIPRDTNITPFAYRVAMGYWKGSEAKGSQDVRVPDLVTAFPSMRTPLKGSANQDAERFYWTYTSKPVTVTPKMVYDRNGSDDAVGSESMNAVWVPHSRSYNFKANRIRSFEGDSGASLEGWNPIFAIQCIALTGQNSFTHPDVITDVNGNTGSNPCPMLQLDVKTYFQDIH